MNRIKIIDGYPCIEFPEGILRSCIDLEYSDKFTSLQTLKDLESKGDLLRELKDKFMNQE